MWNGFVEQLRECGRNATLFIVATLAVSAGLVAVPSLGRLTVSALVGLIIFAVVRLALAWKHAAHGFEKLGRLPPLSEPDRRRARERLLRGSVARLGSATQRLGVSSTAGRLFTRGV